MSVDKKLINRTVSISGTVIKGQLSKEELLRNYVPVVMEHISKHGCSGLKCKRCPLNNICDRDASKAKDLANQMIVYANTQRQR